MDPGQRSYGHRQTFIRARAMAQESGKPVYVVYDSCDRTYAAQDEPPVDIWETLISKVDSNIKGC